MKEEDGLRFFTGGSLWRYGIDMAYTMQTELVQSPLVNGILLLAKLDHCVACACKTHFTKDQIDRLYFVKSKADLEPWGGSSGRYEPLERKIQ